jgi:moderate conductance mechanosensitive channel
VVMHALTPLMSAPAGAPADSLNGACLPSPGIACQLVWDISHSATAAQFTRVFVARPVELALRIAFVLILALVARFAAGRLIRRVTTRAATRDVTTLRPHALLGERRQQRASALGSVLGNAATMTIFTICAFIILGDLGLNLAPVLASAGVIGIAIGFGAQNLVQDFLAGIFMLLEDQYGVGDVINIDGVTGTVEAVSLRITRVRDVNGVIWNIRNGTVSKSGNESHGWARAVVDFPLPYNLDITEARPLMEQAAVAMWQEEAWHDVIMERPEVWGVQEVTSDSVLVRVIARTSPLRQWEVGRELRERLMVALADLVAAAGPHAALPEGTVSVTGDSGDPDDSEDSGAGDPDGPGGPGVSSSIGYAVESPAGAQAAAAEAAADD